MDREAAASYQKLTPGPRYDQETDYKVSAAFFDVDNTLVGNSSSALPTERFKNAVVAARNKLKVSFISARPLSKMAHIIEYTDTDGFAVLSNGAQIYDCTSRTMLIERVIDHTTCMHVVNELENLGIEYWINDDGVDYFSQHSKPLAFTRHVDIWNTTSDLVPMPDYTPTKPLVIVAHAITNEMFTKIRSMVEAIDDPTTVCFIAHEITREDGTLVYDAFITHKRANKTDALYEIITRERLDIDTVMVVGDGRNDADVIKTAGIGVAMGNAVKEVLEVATFIAPDQSNDGAAIALEYFVRETRYPGIARLTTI